MRRALKYVLLIVPAFLASFIMAPYGDRCSGLAHAIAWMLIVCLYGIIFLTITAIDLYRTWRLGQRFDFVPIILTCVGAVINIAFIKSENAKPWTQKTLEGRIRAGDDRGCGLTLYKNGTFEVVNAYADWACTYAGHFEWHGDTLHLLRDDLSSATDSTFATQYYRDASDNSLAPVASGFEPILIHDRSTVE